MTRRTVRLGLVLALLACAGCASSEGTWIHRGLHEVPAADRADEPAATGDHVAPASTSPHR